MSSPEPVLLDGRYRIDREIARGGMGVVYQGTDLRLERPIAIKSLLSTDADSRRTERLRREALAVSRLNHANIVAVFDFLEEGGRCYMIMRLVDGEPLSERLKRDGPLDPHLAASVACKIAGALEVAHQEGVLHRDVKPDNVLLDRQSQPLLTDFGLAKWGAFAGTPDLECVQPGADVRLTKTGALLGTPHYMPPENLNGGANADARSDIYSLGATLYEMLTGRPPIQGETLGALLPALASEVPVPPSALREEVPEALDRICMRCLEKDPAERFPTAGVLTAALSVYLQRSSADVAEGAPRVSQVELLESLPAPAPASPALPPLAPPPHLPPHGARAWKGGPRRRLSSVAPVALGCLAGLTLAVFAASRLMTHGPDRRELEPGTTADVDSTGPAPRTEASPEAEQTPQGSPAADPEDPLRPAGKQSLARAIQHAHDGANLEEALAGYDAAAAHPGADPQRVYVERLDFLVRRIQRRRALELLARAPALDPDTDLGRFARVLEAQALRLDGEPQRSSADLTRALGLLRELTSVSAWRDVGEASLLLAEVPAKRPEFARPAEQLCERLRAPLPGLAERTRRGLLSLLLFKRGRTADAEAITRQHLSDVPDDAGSLWVLATILSVNPDWQVREEIPALLGRALDLTSPDTPVDLLFNRMQALCVQGDFPAGSECARDPRLQNSTSTRVALWRAIVHAEAGQSELAAQDTHTAFGQVTPVMQQDLAILLARNQRGPALIRSLHERGLRLCAETSATPRQQALSTLKLTEWILGALKTKGNAPDELSEVILEATARSLLPLEPSPFDADTRSRLEGSLTNTSEDRQEQLLQALRSAAAQVAPASAR